MDVIKLKQQCRLNYLDTGVHYKSKYEGKVKCARCRCHRHPVDFINNDKQLKSCNRCRKLSLNFYYKKKAK